MFLTTFKFLPSYRSSTSVQVDDGHLRVEDTREPFQRDGTPETLDCMFVFWLAAIGITLVAEVMITCLTRGRSWMSYVYLILRELKMRIHLSIIIRLTVVEEGAVVK